jgi:hypothetical protein
MSWEDVVEGIESDKQATDARLQRVLYRGLAIEKGWKPLWDAVVLCLRAEIKKLDKKLHDKKVLELANNLGVVCLHENCYSVQNPAFPMIDLKVTCVPKEQVSVAGMQHYSGLRAGEDAPSQQFRFAVDRDFEPCLEGNGELITPSQVADKITETVAVFFRKVASRHDVA